MSETRAGRIRLTQINERNLMARSRDELILHENGYSGSSVVWAVPQRIEKIIEDGIHTRIEESCGKVVCSYYVVENAEQILSAIEELK